MVLNARRASIFELVALVALAGLPAKAEPRLSRPISSSVSANSESSLSVKTERSEEKLRAWLTGAYYSMSNNGTALSGVSMNGSLLYAFQRKVGALFGLEEGFSTSGSATFTNVTIGGAFALTGALTRKNQTISIGEREVSLGEEVRQGGIRLQGFLSQYLFQSKTAAIPFSGVGVAGIYEFPSSSNINYAVGVRMDSVANANVTITPMRFTFSVGF